MIRLCSEKDFDSIYEVINDAADAYRGVIPEDRWHEPYMTKDELQEEIEDGVIFWGYEDDGKLIGVMGFQDTGDVNLIRHAYVRTDYRNQGIGGKILNSLKTQKTKPLLVGTWEDAVWAIGFYQKHGFELVSKEESARLLRKYWSIPDRQIETSVVLVEKEYR